MTTINQRVAESIREGEREIADTLNKAVALSILNERNAEGARFGDALMDTLCEVGLGVDLPAEEWDDVLLGLVGRLAGWLQDGVTVLPRSAHRSSCHHADGGDPCSCEWHPGDPCRACGSTDTGWNSEQGGFCLGCERSDSDDD